MHPCPSFEYPDYCHIIYMNSMNIYTSNSSTSYYIPCFVFFTTMVCWQNPDEICHFWDPGPGKPTWIWRRCGESGWKLALTWFNHHNWKVWYGFIWLFVVVSSVIGLPHILQVMTMTTRMDVLPEVSLETINHGQSLVQKFTLWLFNIAMENPS